MSIERPDLSQIEPEIRAYIEALEARIEQLQSSDATEIGELVEAEFTEPPTTLNILTLSRDGQAKRTPRHLYSRQRRSGMGIFDLDTSDDDPSTQLIAADEQADLLFITNQARLFRLPVNTLPESPVRSRGQSLVANLPLNDDEHPTIILPHQRSGYLVVISEQGQVRRQRYHYFGDNMVPGHPLYDVRTMGVPVSGCWSGGDDDLFIATRQGRATRFAEQSVPLKGCLGIRPGDNDTIVAITAVTESSGVFLLTADGQGTIRLMAGFSANKAPGSSGKVAMKTDALIAALTVDEADDIFIISRLSKIIRFQAAEVPPKEGVVQGVNCMSLRSDETVAVVASKVNL